MPIKVGFGKQTRHYEFSSYGKNCFNIKYENHEISLETPLELSPPFDDHEFDLYFLSKKEVKENSIFQVFDKKADKRIGWLIPINSLESNAHDFAEDQYFLKYAGIGIIKALKMVDETIYTKELPIDIESVKLSEIFHEETVLLIISKAALTEGVEFDISRATPSFIKYGYVRLGASTPNELVFKANSPEHKRVRIELISEDIVNKDLISELLNSAFAYEKKTVFKFFFIYQIIELLIENIYQNEQDALIQELLGVQGDSGETKNSLDNLQNFMSERARLKKLINNYSTIAGELNELKIVSNKLLDSVGRKGGNSFEQYFYSIRNFLFHQYRDFPKASESLLEGVIKESIEILPSMLSEFKKPI